MRWRQLWARLRGGLQALLDGRDAGRTRGGADTEQPKNTIAEPFLPDANSESVSTSQRGAGIHAQSARLS